MGSALIVSVITDLSILSVCLWPLEYPLAVIKHTAHSALTDRLRKDAVWFVDVDIALRKCSEYSSVGMFLFNLLMPNIQCSLQFRSYWLVIYTLKYNKNCKDSIWKYVTFHTTTIFSFLFFFSPFLFFSKMILCLLSEI